MYVLDTNILVAALWSRSGSSFRLLELALKGELPVAVSVALALEYEAVLTRAALREASWASLEQLDIVLDALLSRALLVAPIYTRLRPALRGPGDDMVLECAAQARATAIVTMNVRDFAVGARRLKIEVIKPGELCRRLAERDPS